MSESGLPGNRVTGNVEKDILRKDLHVVQLVRVIVPDKHQSFVVEAVVMYILATDQGVRTVFQIDILAASWRSTTSNLRTNVTQHNFGPPYHGRLRGLTLLHHHIVSLYLPVEGLRQPCPVVNLDQYGDIGLLQRLN